MRAEDMDTTAIEVKVQESRGEAKGLAGVFFRYLDRNAISKTEGPALLGFTILDGAGFPHKLAQKLNEL